MITVINLKKIKVPALAVLLFLVITAIILLILHHGRAGEGSVPAMGAARQSAAPTPAAYGMYAAPNRSDIHTLVIDAGHGGADGGASAADGTLESAINLQIALRMEALAKLCGVPTVMTRADETLDYPAETDTIREMKVWDQKARVARINATENAVLISVHQNKYPDARPSGAQVLYAKTEGSKEFAELTHANLVIALDPQNRRVAAPISDSIFLMKSVTCPAILTECGFLSNPAEAEKLKTGEYQTELAAVLIGSYLQYTNDT